MPGQVLKRLRRRSLGVRRSIIFHSLLLLLAVAQGLIASAGEPDVPRVAVPEAKNPPRIDASLRDTAWASAAEISNLALAIKTNLAGVQPPTTHVFLLWSPKYLYIRFICDGAKIYAPFHGSNPNLFKEDVVEVFLDPAGDSRQWYEVEISPHNDLLEKNWLMTNMPEVDQDHALTPKALRDLWEDKYFIMKGLISAAHITPDGWIADLAIPATAILRRTGGNVMTHGTLRANFIRYEWPLINGKRVMVPLNWCPVRQGCPHISPGIMGYLDLQAAP